MNKFTRLIRWATRWAWQRERGICDGIIEMTELHVKPGAMELHMKQNPALGSVIAHAFAAILADAPNYAEMQFRPSPIKHDGKWDWITVTVTKLSGLTPHQIKVKAEEERDKAIAQKKKAYEMCIALVEMAKFEGPPDIIAACERTRGELLCLLRTDAL